MSSHRQLVLVEDEALDLHAVEFRQREEHRNAQAEAATLDVRERGAVALQQLRGSRRGPAARLPQMLETVTDSPTVEVPHGVYCEYRPPNVKEKIVAYIHRGRRKVTQ